MTPTRMTADQVPVAAVQVRDRLRPVSEAGVDSLLASIAEVGVMKDPIHVRKRHDGDLVLIAGGHRLEAARRLGWEMIPATVWTNVTDAWARLMEIDDNLAGAEMSILDTAIFLARRKEVYQDLHPETKRGVAGGLARQNSATDIVSFAESTAQKFGLTQRHVRRMILAGGRLTDEDAGLLRVLAKPVTLKDLSDYAREPADGVRAAAMAALRGGDASSLTAAVKLARAQARGVQGPTKRPLDANYRALRDAWSRASKPERKKFLRDEGKVIFDLLREIREGGDA